jgi:hypothetical protein
MAKPLPPAPVDNDPEASKVSEEQKKKLGAYISNNTWGQMKTWFKLLQSILKGVTNDGTTITIPENVVINGNETVSGSINGLPSTPGMASRDGQDGLSVFGPNIIPYTVTAAPNAGSFTAVTAGWYSPAGNTVTVYIEVTITAIGTGSGFVTVNLPIATGVSHNGSTEGAVLPGAELGNTGKLLSCRAALGTTSMTVAFYDNSYCAGTANNKLVITGSYSIV